jgi:hypothetical protein
MILKGCTGASGAMKSNRSFDLEEQLPSLVGSRYLPGCLVIELHYGAISKGVPTYEKETFEFRASLPMMWRKTLLR